MGNIQYENTDNSDSNTVTNLHRNNKSQSQNTALNGTSDVLMPNVRTVAMFKL